MKIRLLIANAYVGGGTARTISSTASALAQRGHDVEVVSVLRRREKLTFPMDPRVRVIPLVDEWSHKQGLEPSGGFKGELRDRWREVAAPRRSIIGHRRDGRTEEWSVYTDLELLRFVLSVRDGVLVGTRPAINLVIAKFARPGVVRVAQDHMNLGSYRPPLRRSIARWYPRLDAVVTLTERDAHEYDALLKGSTRVLAIPNGVPDLGGHRATLDSKVVITAGRLAKQKGYDRLLPVWARVAAQRPDWRLEIYGAGPVEDALKEQLEALNLQGSAKLKGRTSELFERMAESSLYVMTSRKEGLPMVLLEAMGVGLPVISYDCPTGPRDIITDGVDGYVVPNGDKKALEARMLELMDDKDKRVRMAEAARQKAENFEVAKLAERWEGLFRELSDAKRLNNGSASRPRLEQARKGAALLRQKLGQR